MLVKSCPGNESIEHYELKQIAKVVAKIRGCQIIGEEVGSFRDYSLHRGKKGIVDVAGAKLSHKAKQDLKDITLYGFEAKATLEDFRSGFNAGAEYTYIIAPVGVVPIEEIPLGIGLYEVDLNDYELNHKKIYKGIELVKRASKRHKKRHYRTKFNMMTRIAMRATNMDIYNNIKIDISEKR